MHPTPPFQASSPAGEFDPLVDYLLAGLDCEATIFHVGQYCGHHWRGSTAGHGLASFHLILHGRCMLHRPDRPAVELNAGDSVFLLRDVPHLLTACGVASDDTVTQPQIPAYPSRDDGTGLVCGFFRFSGALSSLMVQALPDCLILHGARNQPPIRAITDLIVGETRALKDPSTSPVLNHLVWLLFFYAIRQAVRDGDTPAGLWALLRRRSLTPLIDALLAAPDRQWTADEMARSVHMSRARFFREFGEACGQAPGQFLTCLRMHVAAQRLERGESISRAAEHVGYQSYAAFSRAFKKVIGMQPGAWCKRGHASRSQLAD